MEFAVGECEEGRVLGGEEPDKPVVPRDDGGEDTEEATGPLHTVAMVVLGDGEE